MLRNLEADLGAKFFQGGVPVVQREPSVAVAVRPACHER
jgi:hypothetical protein